MSEKTVTIERKIGSNRGAARLWIEGKDLLNNGWKQGDRFNAIFTPFGLTYAKAADGKRKVAGTSDRPIIDTNTNKLLAFADIGDMVEIIIDADGLTIR